jgi:hypothetical protein
MLVAERLNIHVQVSRKLFFTFTEHNTNIHTVIHKYDISENPQVLYATVTSKPAR